MVYFSLVSFAITASGSSLRADLPTAPLLLQALAGLFSQNRLKIGSILSSHLSCCCDDMLIESRWLWCLQGLHLPALLALLS